VANRICKFMVDNSIGTYATAVGDAFLEDYFSGREVCEQHRKRVEMIVYRLNDCLNGNMPALRRSPHTSRISLTDQSVAILEEYLGWCEAHGYKPSTIRAKSKYCGDFLLYLADLGCEDVDDITPKRICTACLMFNNKGAWGHVRVFLRYLYDYCHVNSDYSPLIPHYRRPFVIPSVYTEDEIRRMEAVIDRTSKTGIRDYAMLLLVNRYGLRAGDIIKLVFSELDFKGGYIRLVQEKTYQPWEGKMLPEVRAALLDYINNARPNVDSDTVFLLTRAPFRGVGNSCMRNAINRCFLIAGIDVKGRRRGPHAFRSSLASSMVNDDVPYEVVRKVLGHAGPNAVRHYAKVDVERLREYAIPVPESAGLFARFLNGEVRI
jgi:integrase